MRSVSAVVVGAGFGGLAAAVRLKEQGVEDLTILERGDRPGGVWRANTYPGAACDIPSRLYSLSFAPNAGWSRKFAPQREIQAYAEEVVDRFGLRGHLRLGTEVERADVGRGAGPLAAAALGRRELDGRRVPPGLRPAQPPAVADLPGVEHVRRRAFHSAEWRHDVAARGQARRGLGTGASVIQIVPAIAERAAT